MSSRFEVDHCDIFDMNDIILKYFEMILNTFFVRIEQVRIYCKCMNSNNFVVTWF